MSSHFILSPFDDDGNNNDLISDIFIFLETGIPVVDSSHIDVTTTTTTGKQMYHYMSEHHHQHYSTRLFSYNNNPF